MKDSSQEKVMPRCADVGSTVPIAHRAFSGSRPLGVAVGDSVHRSEPKVAVAVVRTKVAAGSQPLLRGQAQSLEHRRDSRVYATTLAKSRPVQVGQAQGRQWKSRD